jgi:CheY-like chemotaxis protein
MSERSFRERSKTSFFFKSVLPSRSENDEPIRLPGLAFLAEDGRPKRVLIVDDDAVILKTLSLKLQAAGYQVIAASDGSDAIRAMREEKPDMIVLDVYFPPDIGAGVSWDGFRLMKWLGAVEGSKRIPVIFITGSPAVAFKQRVLASGALGVFEKPIDHAKLITLIQRGLAGKPPQLDSNFQI